MRILTILFLLFALPATAQVFKVEGDTLIYDTEGDGSAGVDHPHVETLLTLLRTHPDITTLQLNSGGGKLWPAFEMAKIVIDFELDTHVHGICESSCVRIMLGGTKRTMSRGSQLGFHQFYWDPEDVEAYYDRERDDSRWDTPFDFASWIYQDTQSEMYEHLSYMIDRGVDPGFAVQSIAPRDGDMWNPYRPVLMAAGVLTE